MNKIMFLFMFLLASCATKAFEIEEMSEDVIKAKRGVNIRIEPVEENK